MHQIKFPKCDYEGKAFCRPFPPETDVRPVGMFRTCQTSEFVRFGVAMLIHDVGASPQSRIGRSEN
jgi:hypothetical protein